MVTIRPVDTHDIPSWLKLRLALWPEDSEATHRDEIERFIAARAREPRAVLLALDASEAVPGFAELSIRPCAEGCRSNRIAPDNEVSRLAHRALGFEDAGLVRCFRKVL